MADNPEQQDQNQTQPEASPETTKMSSTEAAAPPTSDGNPKAIPNLSFTIWPPSQRTRDAVTNRLIETLTSESVLSKRYGTVPHDVAAELAKKIEEEAFSNAGEGNVNPEDDGIETLQVYSKEISKRMLDAVKSRSPPTDAAPAAAVEEAVKAEEKDAPAEEKAAEE